MRALWVVGSSGANLGSEVINQGILNTRWDGYFGSDEQTANVTVQECLNVYVANIRSSGYNMLDVVYCAGLNLLNPIDLVDEMDMYRTFDVNVMGFIRVLKAVLIYFPGSALNVVAIASDAARNPMRNSITYCASKAALVQAVRVAARELAPHVRVNAVSPSIIEDTPMTWAIDAEVRKQRGWSDEEAREYECSLIPMGRRAEKSEVARVILQTLAGPDFLTGANIEITGGK